MDTPILKLDHIVKSFGSFRAVDDLCLDNRPAILLCAQVSARQEYHADRKPVGHWPVAAVRNRIVEKADG